MFENQAAAPSAAYYENGQTSRPHGGGISARSEARSSREPATTCIVAIEARKWRLTLSDDCSITAAKSSVKSGRRRDVRRGRATQSISRSLRSPYISRNDGTRIVRMTRGILLYDLAMNGGSASRAA